MARGASGGGQLARRNGAEDGSLRAAGRIAGMEFPDVTSLLGLDVGLTVTKAVVFDANGAPLAVARRRVAQSMPRPRWVERDMDALWDASAEAVAEALAASARPPGDVAAVAATAHGDGLYLLGADRRPLGPGILSLDSRAGGVVRRWSEGPVFAEALRLTGQVPHASAPSALLAWIAEHQPERLGAVAHVLSCKDWLRLRLTGTIGTDRTEASTAFTDVRTQEYDRGALRLFGLGALWDALPPVAGSAEVVGRVTAEAAGATGLAQGTPVAAGLHDVTASALGIGAHVEGMAGIVAGTYSINEVVSDAPRTDPRWLCRNAVTPGRWNAMAISPASTANYDWFLDALCAAEPRDGLYDRLAREVDAALERPAAPMFHPYLYGSPHGPEASAGFLGLRGWHDRGDLLRAVLEGIAFNHRLHVDALRDGFAFAEARLTGGASRNPAFARMMADVLGMPVTVPAVEEAAAWGAALCAGAAVGLFETPWDDPSDPEAVAHHPERADAYAERYALHGRITEALRPLWPAMEGPR